MRRTDLPILAKLPPFAGEGDRDGVLAMASAAEDGGASGLTCTNTIPVADARMSTGRGGLSGGPHDDPHAGAGRGGPRRRPVCRSSPAAASSPPTTRRACLDAGAVAVQVYTALIYEGPALLRRLTEGLAARVPAAD